MKKIMKRKTIKINETPAMPGPEFNNDQFLVVVKFKTGKSLVLCAMLHNGQFFNLENKEQINNVTEWAHVPHAL